jgi:signal transduction histidine kinase
MSPHKIASPGVSLPAMSIRLRITVALTLIGVVLFGTYGVVAYRTERRELHASATRELRVLGRSLATALGNALRDRQNADVEESLATVEAIEPEVDIHVLGADARAVARSRGARRDPVVDELLSRAASSGRELVAQSPGDDPERLVFAAPLTGDDGALLGTVAISRPVSDLREDLARTRTRLLGLVAIFLVITMGTGLVLGTTLVGRPIARLLEGMRHVREGDFRSPVKSGRRDEIGELVDEFNAMIAALADARSRGEAETEARARIEQGLQRVDKMVTIGQLSAGLAHEIGSPLQVMSGRASALREHPDPEVRRQAELLVSQCERITRVVEQLLSFGRRRTAVIAACDVVEPVRSVIDLIASEARRHGISLAMMVEGKLHRIDADPDQLQQLTLNLVRNALAATPRGGKIEVRIDTHEDRVRLIVTDTGAGIPAEVQGRLFEPFFTTRAAEGGTGLGLAVVRAIATEHRATIEIESTPGAGARFVVAFPRREED